ncbi:uncharacterized protein LOC141612521 isoform X4 [Silene latifolia]|uniref:uncharacterized protein LOC141612521 isoform X4 n=1 Tax=Silene latifolia TaxID=37657 RepID=UPI003D77EDAF
MGLTSTILSAALFIPNLGCFLVHWRNCGCLDPVHLSCSHCSQGPLQNCVKDRQEYIMGIDHPCCSFRSGGNLQQYDATISDIKTLSSRSIRDSQPVVHFICGASSWLSFYFKMKLMDIFRYLRRDHKLQKPQTNIR